MTNKYSLLQKYARLTPNAIRRELLYGSPIDISEYNVLSKIYSIQYLFNNIKKLL